MTKALRPGAVPYADFHGKNFSELTCPNCGALSSGAVSHMHEVEFLFACGERFTRPIRKIGKKTRSKQ